MSFQSSPSPSAGSQQQTNSPMPPASSLQMQMNLMQNLMQFQNVGEQMLGMSGQQTQFDGSPSMAYNPPAALVEQQFKINQLQQLQQLQNQIFQHQIALISGQSILPAGHSMNRNDFSSNSLPLSAMKDQSFTSTSPHNSYPGLPTPGPSTEIRPRDSPMEFVPPMVLGADSLFDPPISPQSTHDTSHISYPHSHSSGTPHFHAHTAPPQVVFDIRSEMTPNSSGADGLSSGSLSNVPLLSNGADNDLDISPLTSPWLGAGSHQRSSVGTDSGLHPHHVRSASFSHLGRSGSKRPADRGCSGDLNSAHGMFESEPARKKHSPDSPSAPRGMNSQQQYQHMTPLTLLPQPNSPLSSPISPLTTAINATNLVTGTGTCSSSSSASGTNSQRRTYRGSMSTGNTPLLRGQRSRVSSNTRGQANNNSSNNTSTSLTGTPSSASIGNGAGTFVADTPSPVDLAMPPPAPPGHVMNSSPSGSGSGFGSKSNQDMDGMGPGGVLLPVTPASIMKLGKLGPSNNNHNNDGDGGHASVPRSWPGEPRDDKKGGGAGEKDKDNGCGKGNRNGSGSAAGSAPTSIAASRTRRNTASTTAATGGVSGSGLKTILPANPSYSPQISASAGVSSRSNDQDSQQQLPRKTSHKAAEQKRRDSLKTAYDELRTLLPPIPLSSDMDESALANGFGIPGAWPPRSSSSLPGSLPPRGPPKTGAEGPNKGVSKLQLLICGNEFIRVLKKRVERRDEEIIKLRDEVGKLRCLVRDMKLGGDGNDMEEDRRRHNEGDYGIRGSFAGGSFDFDWDLDLEKDLDAVEMHNSDANEACGNIGGMMGGGMGMGTGVVNVGLSVNALGSLGEQPDQEEED
ncbi:transcriptional regulator family: Helix-loop-helix [Agaricus bisporus var. burnettii]|uniref:Transcriptional regulator family: Helix-loop-helix n=1 Tax=Agaricus bisporus var. burnettii TaxID=192524 RepID=A0A8H7C6D5_AGABI|nr:transcriptional regulator family: Helix-loop-helix [Agaricus bisporus var. burnettii]